ncbi:MAG TPA: Coenzyme F420 hydrogenase/dehydrogenase, beta subunit C-terminal domain [Methanoculleus sp.]|jgi:formate dehydrogenase subunit beta|uniref:Coenzyme F420 hydrogenase/dehydrogenase, beta subunit C-terminal domain n=1 Tax=Methanoculleus sp. TaxID=90427 RepID=UPI000AC5EFDF|nr:Coenzyme F420 hydrogenase/dehydrogenase, beta subunit C-terminal domain [Methanoculleus sp.]MBP7144636.1 Coenzyme F420 hydrogenase/dehydrogenase, beta subunit C-terminal domain [Methanoculleus sp.]HOF97668.1 Coenzyme F420 hydrogenase/dehydrogenase, beta subunit C-terminal domain [Methanoculleus sp.]HOI62040.1 Coenzyme F420 hydrogenase/dehydrogenase, beta subunit C-terminal domain [Methanoculleus sp.]HQL58554.1 Coenzyme F420 hydrogenase/dehydrogenase, beta subunit C-terminal domain [Methanocu
MAAIGDMFYTWAADADVQKRGECGGAITALQQYALKSGMVDAVLAVRKGADIYDAVPTVITDPAEVAETAGSLHCGTLLLSKLVKNYLDSNKTARLGVTVKGCDTMGLIELAKRNQVDLDRVILLGVNCGGSVSPVLARKMIREKFEVDPDIVHKEEIDKGQFIIEYEGGHKGIKIDDLEDEGYGRRSNCRRCLYKVPRQADLACGNWGVIGEKAGKATFVEVCSEKGANLLDAAIKAGAVMTEPANPKGIEIRGKVEGAMLNLGNKWRKKDFGALASDLWGTISRETGRCIKCYSCIENCPVCFPVAKDFKGGSRMIASGEVPPNPMFHLRRFTHISDSCINCGQCEELCPMEIPLALFSHAIRTEGDSAFESKLGKAPYSN